MPEGFEVDETFLEVDYSKMFPNINYYLHRPVLSEPKLADLRELQDGTYSIDDLIILHDILDFKAEVHRRDMERLKQQQEQLEQEMSNG